MVVKKPRIIIVGAGVAGLTAAHRLHTAAGDLLDLCVLEAGDRIGGRLLTTEFAGDRVEMGATWIHGIDGSPIHAIAADIGALDGDARPWERMDGFPENPITIAEGTAAVIDPSEVTALHKRLMDAARSGDASVTKESRSVGSLLRRGLREYLAESGGGDGALEEAVFAMHDNWERTCTSADDLSDLDLAAETEYRDFPGDQITIAAGYSRIVDWLAAALPPGSLQLGRRVRRIEWLPDYDPIRSSDGPVRIHFDDFDVAAADHVIVTVSLGVLKAGLRKAGCDATGVAFSPCLPPFKREAIGRLGFGVVNKLFMELDTEEGPFPFLQLAFRQDSQGHVAKIPRWIRKTAFVCPIYGGSRVLLAWLAGEEAAEIESMKDEEIVDGINATLQKLAGAAGYGGRISKVKRSAWRTDPLFLGSYSYVAVGSSGDDLDLMAEPLPRCGGEREAAAAWAAPPPLQILFGGEATHRTRYSTTHGAYFSGIREANRLLQHYRFITTP